MYIKSLLLQMSNQVQFSAIIVRPMLVQTYNVNVSQFTKDVKIHIISYHHLER